MPDEFRELARELEPIEGDATLPPDRLKDWSDHFLKSANRSDTATKLIVFAMRLHRQNLVRACGDILQIAAALLGSTAVRDTLEHQGLSTEQARRLVQNTHAPSPTEGLVAPGGHGVRFKG